MQCVDEFVFYLGLIACLGSRRDGRQEQQLGGREAKQPLKAACLVPLRRIVRASNLHATGQRHLTHTIQTPKIITVQNLLALDTPLQLSQQHSTLCLMLLTHGTH